MMSVNDFSCKQIVFVFTNEKEKISFKNDNIILLDKEGKIKLQLTCYRLFALFICGNYCLTSGLLDRAKKFCFNIVLMTEGMRTVMILPSAAQGNVLLRRRQYTYDKLDIAKHIICNKIGNQLLLLKKRRGKTPFQKDAIKHLEEYTSRVKGVNLTAQEVMGLEGVSSKVYFSSLFCDYNWKGRFPRTKIDMINTLMDIGYTILFNLVNALLEMYGFDVYVGILHTQFFHRKSLSCDIEEPFRVIIDEAILKALNLGQVNDKDFFIDNNQYILNYKNGKKYVTLFLEAIMKHKDKIFLYIQSYYRAFVSKKDTSLFPIFSME